MHPSLHWIGMASMALAVSGCSSLPFGWGDSSTATPPPRPVERCDAQAAQWAVGKTNTEQHVSEARRRAGAYMARVLRPGQITTREFNAERLNLEVDATGRIIAARCG